MRITKFRIDELQSRANTLDDARQSSAPNDVEPARKRRRSAGSSTSSGPPESPAQVSAVRVPTGPAQNITGRSKSPCHSRRHARSDISRIRPAYSVGASTSIGSWRTSPKPAISPAPGGCTIAARDGGSRSTVGATTGVVEPQQGDVVQEQVGVEAGMADHLRDADVAALVGGREPCCRRARGTATRR